MASEGARPPEPAGEGRPLRVVALARYGRRGASSRLRFYQYGPLLAAAGIRLEVLPLLSDTYLERRYAGRGRLGPALAGAARRLGALAGRARRADLLWIEQEVLPWVPAAWELACLPRGIPWVVDCDDAIFHRYDAHPHPLVRRLLGHKIDRLMARAALVTAGNAYLAARARRAGAPRVAVVPTVVDLARYPPPAGEQRRAGPAVIGWVGSPATEHYLLAIGDSLRRVCRRTGARLHLVGASPALAAAFPDVAVAVIPWREEDEVAQIGRFDVGIMPLADTPWERGKCGYKLIQYMACGLPVVASPVGVNPALVGGDAGFLAAGAEEWERHLEALVADPELRRRMGAAGRARVEREYALSRQAPRLAALLRGCRQDAADAAGGV